MWSLLELNCLCLNEIPLKSFFYTTFAFLTFLGRRRFFSFEGIIWAYGTLITTTVIEVIFSKVAIR